MAEIALEFCAFKSFFGRLIDFGTQGEVGHVDAVLPSGELLGAQHESGLGGAPSGVQIRPARYQMTCGGYNVLRVTIAASTKTERAFYDFLRAQIGKPYDLKMIFGFAAGRDWRDPGAWICSELQAAACEAAKIFPHPLRVWKDRVTPQELLLLASALGRVEQIR